MALRLLIIFVLILTWNSPVWPKAERVVIVKADGVPFDLLDRYVRETDPQTLRSLLPWIAHVFYDRGTRLSNFYVRGLSLSAPAWALLDTGQPSLIKGNVEFDRLTQRSYDYLNFFSYFLKESVGRHVEMPGVEVLDEQEIPLLSDAYARHERHSGVQLFQRGSANLSLKRSLKHFLSRKNPREMLDEWTMGLEGGNILFELWERELITALNDPRVRYLDYMTPVFDHIAHLNNDRATQLGALQQIDALIGRLWTAIEKSSMATETALILVSDHGMNTDEKVYSQGYNLVKFFGSAAGGGHHIVTHRPPRGDYTFKALSPAVPLVTTAASESYYLRNQSSPYPTLLLDSDGNERASVYLRHSDLNLLHILLQQLGRKDLTPTTRAAISRSFFATLERNRSAWSAQLSELSQELAALRRSIEKTRLEVRSAVGEKQQGKAQENPRRVLQSTVNEADVREYTIYAHTLTNLLSLRPESFDRSRWKIEELIPPRSLGSMNSLHGLQNYVVALVEKGGVLDAQDSLDLERNLIRIDYFDLLTKLRVRNNVQPGVVSSPVDFLAVAMSPKALTAELPQDCLPVEAAVWLYKSRDEQALILARHAESGLSLRYLPVRDLVQHANDRISFSPQSWRSGLPLQIWEDSGLRIPDNRRADWLGAWHSETEWLRALHATKYSNGLISLYEQFAFDFAPSPPPHQELEGSTDHRLLLRFRQRKRQLAQPDFIVFANDHWNFNIRGFNPGGNHGSFMRASTHATLMFAGGAETGIRQGWAIEEPYDSLSFVPTVLSLTGRWRNLGMSLNLRERRFQSFPGRIIHELFADGTIGVD